MLAFRSYISHGLAEVNTRVCMFEILETGTLSRKDISKLGNGLLLAGKGRIPRHRHRHPREDPHKDVGVVECGLK